MPLRFVIQARRAWAISVMAACVAAPARADEMLFFQSPSGNIHCMMETGEWPGVRCDMIDLRLSNLRPPPNCELDWGSAFFVGAQFGGELACVGDTVITPQAQVLNYGQAAKLGAFVCTSAKSGVTCTNGQGHGFSLSKSEQKLF